MWEKFLFFYFTGVLDLSLWGYGLDSIDIIQNMHANPLKKEIQLVFDTLDYSEGPLKFFELCLQLSCRLTVNICLKETQ